MQSASKKKIKSVKTYERRRDKNRGIKIKDEIQEKPPFQITRKSERSSFMDSNLISVKTESNTEEMNSIFIITEYEQNIENAPSDCTDVTSLTTDSTKENKPFSSYESTDAIVKVKNEFELISDKFQLNTNSSIDCDDIAIVRNESEHCLDSSQNEHSVNASSFEYNAGNQLLKIEPELQIEPCFENIQQERDFKEELLKESDSLSYVCLECGECLKTAQAQQLHMSEQHSKLTNRIPLKKIKCKLCGDLNDCMNSLLSHIKSVHNADLRSQVQDSWTMYREKRPKRSLRQKKDGSSRQSGEGKKREIATVAEMLEYYSGRRGQLRSQRQLDASLQSTNINQWGNLTTSTKLPNKDDEFQNSPSSNVSATEVVPSLIDVRSANEADLVTVVQSCNVKRKTAADYQREHRARKKAALDENIGSNVLDLGEQVRLYFQQI